MESNSEEMTKKSSSKEEEEQKQAEEKEEQNEEQEKEEEQQLDVAGEEEEAMEAEDAQEVEKKGGDDSYFFEVESLDTLDECPPSTYWNVMEEQLFCGYVSVPGLENLSFKVLSETSDEIVWEADVWKLQDIKEVPIQQN